MIKKLEKSKRFFKEKKVKKELDLLECLFGKTRRLIITLLFSQADESFHLRKIRRLIGVSPGAAQRELTRLSDAGIILRTIKDNQVIFQANSRCPIFGELKSLITKTAGIADVLRAALRPLERAVRMAFIYGSIAHGKEKRESDVDLLVIGDVKFSEIVEVLSPVQQALSREINPMVLSVEELKKRIQDADHFIESVLKTTLIPVIGELDELNGMAEKRFDR